MKRYSIAALVTLGVLALGCSGQKEAIPDQAGNDGVVILTTTIGLDETTRALTADGVKTFVPGDKVAIIYEASAYFESEYLEQTMVAWSWPLEAKDIFDNGKKAFISVPLFFPKSGGEVSVVYPADMVKGVFDITGDRQNIGGYDFSIFSDLDYSQLDNQDGTLSSLADIDLSIYTGRLTAETLLPANITLSNQLAIAAFTVVDENGTDITASITKLDFNDGINGYSVSRTAEEGPIYMALQPVSADRTILLSANAGSVYYLKTVTGKTLDAGKMYPVEVEMAPDETGLSQPLTIEAAAAGALVGFHYNSSVRATVEYSLNGGPWTEYDNGGSGIRLENAGDKVSFRGDNAYYGKYQSGYQNSYFFADYQDCYVYGNVMSLVNATGFVTEKCLTASYAFYRLFASQGHFLSHPTRKLVLPATTLSTHCYESMFEGSTGLTRAPALPAEALSQYCYKNMFHNCTGLVEAPALNARTLAGDCCNGMFWGCTALQEAPALPAETLAYYCYGNMFSGCSALVTPPVLPATVLENSCYLQMFKDCTSLETAPVLPAPTLASRCYQNMFWGCSSLNRVVCLATDLSASDCTLSWLYKTPETGTFVKPSAATWDSGTSGIPEGWTVQTYVAP